MMQNPHSQLGHGTVDAMQLLTTSINNHLDRVISNSHTMLLDRIVKQDEIQTKQQEIIKDLSDRVARIANFPSSDIDPMLVMQDMLQNMQSHTRRLMENIEEELTRVMTSLKDFHNSMNQLFENAERRLLRFLPRANAHAQDDDNLNSREHTVDDALARGSSSSETPATVLPSQWNHLQLDSQRPNSRDQTPNGSHHGTRLGDFDRGHEDYNSGINENLCINPLNTLRNPTSGSSHQNSHSNTPPNESTAYQHLSGTSTPSLPDPSSLLNETPRNQVTSTSVVLTSPGTRNRSDTIRSYESALTELSELDSFFDERPAAGILVPVSFSPETTKEHSQDDGRRTKRPRLNFDPSQPSQSQTQSKARKRRKTQSSPREPKSRPKGSNQSKTDIWPKRGKKNATSNQFIQCDRCQLWFHWGCVAIHEGDTRLEEDSKFACPPCVLNNAEYKPRSTLGPGNEHCSRPDCKIKGKPQEEFFIERFVGRYDRGALLSGPGRYSWLIKWEGYSINNCVWTPGDEIEAARALIEKFELKAKAENAFVGGGNLVLLDEAIQAGWATRLE